MRIIWDKDKIPLFRNKLMNNHEELERLTRELCTQPIDIAVNELCSFLQTHTYEIFGKTQNSLENSIKYMYLNNKLFLL